jgi:hypothetical protein
VGGAAGNSVFEGATVKIQHEVSTGTALTVAMTNANLFPSMVLQMCAIGEESGSIDHMLGKAADFYEAEVDDMVAGISSLMEPIIIVILGTDHRRHRGGDVPAHLQARARWFDAGSLAADAAVFGVLGLLIGSFLNVVIHRLPEDDGGLNGRTTAPNWPARSRARSARSVQPDAARAPGAPSCQHQIRWYENIPVLSYLVCAARCSKCKHVDQHPRYPAVELITAVFLRVRMALHHGLTPAGLAWAAFASLLIAQFFIDFDTQLLPDDLNYLILWGGLIASPAMHLTTVAVRRRRCGAPCSVT